MHSITPVKTDSITNIHIQLLLWQWRCYRQMVSCCFQGCSLLQCATT